MCKKDERKKERESECNKRMLYINVVVILFIFFLFFSKNIRKQETLKKNEVRIDWKRAKGVTEVFELV